MAWELSGTVYIRNEGNWGYLDANDYGIYTAPDHGNPTKHWKLYTYTDFQNGEYIYKVALQNVECSSWVTKTGPTSVFHMDDNNVDLEEGPIRNSVVQSVDHLDNRFWWYLQTHGSMVLSNIGIDGHRAIHDAGSLYITPVPISPSETSPVFVLDGGELHSGIEYHELNHGAYQRWYFGAV